LTLLCKLLQRREVETVIFATGSHWDSATLAGLSSPWIKFRVPPGAVRTWKKLSAIYCRLAWPFMMPRQAASLYCISPGGSQLLLHRLKPPGALSVNHEIVEPPGPDSMAGRCAATLDATVANSRKVAGLMRGYWPKKPIRSIPFLTADGPTEPPASRRRPGPRDLLRVVYLGRLVEQKRPDVLVRRWAAMNARPDLNPARLDVFGFDPDGKMLAELRAFVAGSRLSESVQVHGEYALSELPRILDEADLVVLPSLWEGLPLVLVEAMLRGVPFVATAAGGTEELGDDNPDVIVTGTDWDAFEAGVVRMARQIRGGLIDPLRLHGWAEDRYGYDAVSRQWFDCLTKPREFFAASSESGSRYAVQRELPAV
jgi:glycosyltransferase involved in cell wall biosynthesis